MFQPAADAYQHSSGPCGGHPFSEESEDEMPKGTKVAASLTVQRPGAMHVRGRKAIAKWLRDRADDIEKHGEELTATGPFRARWHYA